MCNAWKETSPSSLSINLLNQHQPTYRYIYIYPSMGQSVSFYANRSPSFKVIVWRLCRPSLCSRQYICRIGPLYHTAAIGMIGRKVFCYPRYFKKTQHLRASLFSHNCLIVRLMSKRVFNLRRASPSYLYVFIHFPQRVEI